MNPSTSTSTAPNTSASTSSNKIKVGSKSIICHDAELRGEITIGAGCIVHPKSTIFALAGPIVIGDSCIIEENTVIINRNKEPMTIGTYNLFEVGCRIEAASMGSYNTFEPKCKVPSTISLGDYCVIGAGCTVVPEMRASEADWVALDRDEMPSVVETSAVSPPVTSHSESGSQESESITLTTKPSTAVPSEEGAQPSAPTPSSKIVEHLPSYTAVYGAQSARRIWSGEGKGQQIALMAKHIAHLSEWLPKYSKLKLIAG